MAFIVNFLSKVLSPPWVLAIPFVALSLFKSWELGKAQRQVDELSAAIETAKTERAVAIEFNQSLNQTIDRMRQDWKDAQAIVASQVEAERQSNHQLADDIAVIKKGFEDAKDYCAEQRPPGVVVERVRSVYERARKGRDLPDP